MWRTPLLVLFTLVLALPTLGMTLRGQAGPRDESNQPGHRRVPLHPVAILGAKSYWVLPPGLVPTVGVVFSRLGLSSGVALGAACNVILTSAHQKYAPMDDAASQMERGQPVGPLGFRADGPHSPDPVVAEAEELFTGTTFAPTDRSAAYRDLRVFRTHTSALPEYSQGCQDDVQIASPAVMRAITAHTVPVRVIVIAFQGVCTLDGPPGPCRQLSLEKSFEKCEAHNPHFSGAVYPATEAEAGLLLLACDTSLVGGPSGGVVAVVDPARHSRLLIIGVISASVTAPGHAARDGLPFHPYNDTRLNVSLATPISMALHEALCRQTDHSMLQPGACSPSELPTSGRP
jgi:hypothetical protein